MISGQIWSTVLLSSEYLVLSGYAPEEPKEEYWSGKVVCVDNDGDSGLTVGKVYTVESGVMHWDGGNKMEWLFKSLDDINRTFAEVAEFTHAKFVELKGSL